MSGWFFSLWWRSHFSSFAPGWSGLCADSGEGIPDILVVCLLPACRGCCSWCLCGVWSGLGQGWGAVAGGGIILTCPLCILIVVINNFVYSIQYLCFVNTRCVNYIYIYMPCKSPLYLLQMNTVQINIHRPEI